MTTPRQTAIVTGASRGIGAAIARRLAADGFAVVVDYAGSEDQANAVVKDIEDAGGQAIAVQGDVAVAASAARLFDEAERLGPVRVLVNNAGRAIRKPLAEFTEVEFDTIVSTNLKGVFLTLSEAAKRLQDGGSIINISASFQGAPIPGYGPYAASKMAIEKLTEVAAKELGERGIRVNALRPGPTNTDLFNQGKSEEIKQQFAQQHALGRIGEPEDVAQVVSFLVSDEAGWVSGQSVGANGGYW
jgi:3-oxoacyl-[acyl-carrier protein] reductase